MRPWDPHGKALLLVQHTTTLHYDAPVVEAYSEVRKTPVATGLQRVLTSKLEVEPPAPLRSHTDYFGSHVHHFNVLEPHDSLRVSAESVVETSDGVCCGPEAAPDPRSWRQRLAEFLHWSRAVPRLPQYAQIPHRLSADQEPEDFLGALHELGGEFRRRFRHDPEATDVHSTPEVLFATGGGVCQDLAHAMIGVLRLAGVAARYASGYVYDPALAEGGRGEALLGTGASHAWVQAFHPERGWVGIDPTNDKLVDWQYVRVAVGRDYSDVQPLRGVFVGSPGQHLEVDVTVKRIG
jgi:transglutaminase-like putative cysteine protease